jgi:SynChlorMet cassette radical SAM/SPASM protein ScmF
MPTTELQPSNHPLATIYFYLTEGCNLRCRHCWIMPEENSSGQGKAILDLGLFESILLQALDLGLTTVKLTGGEPLLHPQIHRLLGLVQRARPKLVVETNGVLLTAELADKIASCQEPFVSVSLDGADSETHEWVRQVPGSYRAALRGIGYLVHAGLRPQIIFTIMLRNRDQVRSIVQLAQELGAGSVKFNILQPSPRGDRMQQENETLTIQDYVEVGRWVEEELAPSVDFPILFSHPPAFIPLRRLLKQNGVICGILGTLGVLANGSYALCGIGETVSELIFGHAARDSLAQVWLTHPVLQEIRAGLPERFNGICRDCLVKGQCLGFCIAQNYYQTQDLWTPYWFCQQAEAAGLFPATRKRPGI